MTRTIWTNFRSRVLRSFQTKFEFNWPCGFRGEDVWNCWQTDAGRRSDWYIISSPMSLRLRWANKLIFFIKIQISKLKNQWCAPQMISDRIAGNSRTSFMSKTFKKFLSGHEAITSCWHHCDPNFMLASLSVVSLAGVCHFYCKTVENVFADDKLIVHYIQNYVARQQHVHLLQEVQTLYFCNLSIAWKAT